MSPSGGRSLFHRAPLLRSRQPCLPLIAIKNIAGCLLTIFVLLLFLLLAPIILLFRFYGHFKKNSSHWKYNLRDCSHSWPIVGCSPEFGLIVSADVEIDRMNFNINDVSLGIDEAATDEEIYGLRTENVVKSWTGSDRRVKTSYDLSGLLNDPSIFPSDRVDIRVINGYSEPVKPSPPSRLIRFQPSCLVLVSNPSRSRICLPRLLSIISNQRMYLDMEPLPSYHFFVPVRHSYCLHNILVISCRLFVFGTASLLSMLFRRQSSIWSHLSGESRKGKKRRTPRTRDSSIENGQEETSKDNGSLRASSLLSSDSQTSHARCWRVVPSMELVGRAERLLRATTAEMMLALVAGTFRNYCRDQGIPHPPDLSCVVPVSCRNFLPVACGYPCDVLSFPLQLPVNVEGTIPRVWEIQKRLLEGLNGHVPATLKIAQVFARCCSTTNSSAGWLRPLFSANAVHVAFYRVSGDFKLSRNCSVETMQLYPSLDPKIKASFVFVQCGRNITLCASLCRKTFPDPNLFLSLFEKETHHLVEHLSVRLLSLPQSTYLPGVQFSGEVEEEEHPPSASDYLREKTTRKTEKNYSLEQLHELLATVQHELDSMRGNPQGDRAEYIRKLAELEGRMQLFHDSITERLGGMETEPDIVENVLAPYKDPPVSSRERRYSRDMLLSDDNRSRRPSSGSRSSI